MITQLLYVTLIVRDYEEAVQWYTRCFGWEKRMDQGTGIQRGVTLGVPGQAAPEIILQVPERFDAATQERKRRQIGQTPTWVMAVADCDAVIAHMQAAGVTILEAPKDSPMGRGALVEDLYGNVFRLFER